MLIDLCSRRVVGWALRRTLSRELALGALTRVDDLPIARPIGEDRGGMIGTVHRSAAKIWSGGIGTA